MKNKMISLVLASGLALLGVAQAEVKSLGDNKVQGYVLPNDEPRVIGFNTVNMTEVVPNALYMKHMVGPDVSVVVINIKRGQPTPLNGAQKGYTGDEASRAAAMTSGKMPPFHYHGQEVAIVIKGHGKVVLENGKEFEIKEGEGIIMPPGIPHTGIFDAPDNLVVSITMPRRPEYEEHNQAEY